MLGESPWADAIGDLARDMGASRFQLIRAYKRAFGLTPEDFRRQLPAGSLKPARGTACFRASVRVLPYQGTSWRCCADRCFSINSIRVLAPSLAQARAIKTRTVGWARPSS
jgi:hypothetical protein